LLISAISAFFTAFHLIRRFRFSLPGQRLRYASSADFRRFQLATAFADDATDTVFIIIAITAARLFVIFATDLHGVIPAAARCRDARQRQRAAA
jgi:hypothetical protein